MPSLEDQLSSNCNTTCANSMCMLSLESKMVTGRAQGDSNLQSQIKFGYIFVLKDKKTGEVVDKQSLICHICVNC